MSFLKLFVAMQYNENIGNKDALYKQCSQELSLKCLALRILMDIF